MNAILTYDPESGQKFDLDDPLGYFLTKFFRMLGFDDGFHFLKCLLLAILDSI
jgi:hypothetical protein